MDEICSSDVNKATSHKAMDFQHRPRPGQGQGLTATVVDQIKISDVTYLLSAEHHS